MLSRDGAVTRMVGAFGDNSDESDSVLDWDAGDLSVTKREKMQRHTVTHIQSLLFV